MTKIADAKSRKYFIAAFLFAGLIFISGVIEPLLKQSEKHKDKNQTEIVSKLEKETKIFFDELQKDVTERAKDFKIFFGSRKNKTDWKDVFEFAEKKLNGLSFGLNDASGKEIVWSSRTDNSLSEHIRRDAPGKIHFEETGIRIYLVAVDTINVKSESFRFYLAKPVKKLYKLNKTYFKDVNIEKTLAEKLGTDVKIHFFGEKEKPSSLFIDVPVLTSKNEKIAEVRVRIPREDETFVGDLFLFLQTFFAVFSVLFFTIGFYKKNGKNSDAVSLFILIVGISLTRVILFVGNFPARFVKTELFEAKYFSSSFGFGIVKSPFEFFITAIFTLAISYLILRFTASREKIKKRSKIYSFVFAAAAVAAVLVLLRSVGAIAHSVIIDSTILYFSDFSLISKPPAFLMQINILLVGTAAFLLQSAFLLVAYRLIERENKFFSFTVMLIASLFFGIVYHYAQPHPQTPVLAKMFYLFTLNSAVFLFAIKKIRLGNFLIAAAFLSSALTAVLLNHYNNEQQQESLKDLAYNLTRPRANWYEYLVHETLSLGGNDERVLEEFVKRDANFDAIAFSIWSQSGLQRESIRSLIAFYDDKGKPLGNYNFNFEEKFIPEVFSGEIKDEDIFLKKEFGDILLLTGTKKVTFEDSLLGYWSAAVLYQLNEIDFYSVPPFLPQNASFLNANIDFNKLAVFEFSGDEVVKQYGDVSLDKRARRQITETKLNGTREGTTGLKIAGEDYSAYIVEVKSKSSKRRIAILTKEKASFSLFHFFKVFFAHSFFILALLLIYGVINLGELRKITWTFRRKLFVALIIISVIPLVLMAVYFRTLTEEKNNSAANYKLQKRAYRVEKYLKSYLTSATLEPKAVFKKANKDLGIEFTIFNSDTLYFSTVQKYYNIGLFPKRLNPDAYFALEKEGREVFSQKEKIEEYSYNAFYYRFETLGEIYVIRIADLFNRILLPVSGTELDIFLFGSYSLAVILIIVTSTLLANQISSPIRQLTKATKSVASGDLGLEVKTERKGEVDGLIEEFNFMVSELKQSQQALADIERETAWKEMAKQVAHEIKNPLTPMKLAVQQLMIAYQDKTEKFDEIFKKVTATLISQIDILTDIASEFSSFARMPSIKMEPVSLNDVVKDSADLFSEENLQIDFPITEKKYIVKADYVQLKRTLINVVRNSIQAGATRLNIDFREDEQNATIVISDDGKGIKSETLEKIFEPGFTTKEEGMGLGLKMAKRFVEFVGGEIKIDSDEGNGTTVFLTLRKIEDA